MSFLYQALLKNNQQAASNPETPPVGAAVNNPNSTGPVHQTMQPAPGFSGQTHSGQGFSGQNFAGQSFSGQSFAGQGPAYGQTAMFAQPTKAGVPAFMWVSLAIALLVIGLLAGYIFGGQQPQGGQSYSNPVPITETVTQLNPVVNTEAEAARVSNAEGQPELIQPANGALVGQQRSDGTSDTSAAKQALANAALSEASNEANNEDRTGPLVEVALSDEGKIITQVTEVPLGASEKQKLVSDASDAAYSEQTESDAEQVILNDSEEEAIDLSEISDALKQQFAQAVEATEQENDPSKFQPSVSSQSSLSFINDLEPTEKAGLPDIEYQMHIYASDVTERWVKLNGRILTQGEEFMPGLKLLEIRQDMIVWESTFDRFAQEALVDFTQSVY